MAKIREIYPELQNIDEAISSPLTRAIINECKGRFSLSEDNWAEASKMFYDSFNDYADLGHEQALICL